MLVLCLFFHSCSVSFEAGHCQGAAFRPGTASDVAPTSSMRMVFPVCSGNQGGVGMVSDAVLSHTHCLQNCVHTICAHQPQHSHTLEQESGACPC
jgi:hypothetical protein